MQKIAVPDAETKVAAVATAEGRDHKGCRDLPLTPSDYAAIFAAEIHSWVLRDDTRDVDPKSFTYIPLPKHASITVIGKSNALMLCTMKPCGKNHGSAYNEACSCYGLDWHMQSKATITGDTLYVPLNCHSRWTSFCVAKMDGSSPLRFRPATNSTAGLTFELPYSKPEDVYLALEVHVDPAPLYDLTARIPCLHFNTGEKRRLTDPRAQSVFYVFKKPPSSTVFGLGRKP